MSPREPVSEQRPVVPGTAMAVVAVVLIVLVATIALTSRQPPPPSIAEFAPQAVENITDAPSDQSFAGTGGAAPTPTPTPEPAVEANQRTIFVPRAHRCVG